MYTNVAAYVFTGIDDPASLAEALRARAQALELRGDGVLLLGRDLQVRQRGDVLREAGAPEVGDLVRDVAGMELRARLAHVPVRDDRRDPSRKYPACAL